MDATALIICVVSQTAAFISTGSVSLYGSHHLIGQVYQR